MVSGHEGYKARIIAALFTVFAFWSYVAIAVENTEKHLTITDKGVKGGPLYNSGETSYSGGTQDYSNTILKIDTLEPICLIDIGTVAELCITGSDMTFDNKQAPIKGAGRIVAKKGKSFTILVAAYSETDKPCKTEQAAAHNEGAAIISELMKRGIDEFRLTMGEIEWDEHGKLTQIRDLAPTINEWTGRIFSITSDLANPTVKDGLLHLLLKGSSDEVVIQISYGGRGTPGDKINGAKVVNGSRFFCLPST